MYYFIWCDLYDATQKIIAPGFFISIFNCECSNFHHLSFVRPILCTNFL